MPVPIRVTTESTFRWIIIDVLVTVVLWILGTGVAGLFLPALSFLDSIAYTTALIIAYFPIGLWMHYCRVSTFTLRHSAILIVGPLTLASIGDGIKGALLVPIALLVVFPMLIAELTIGKRLLTLLPASSSRKMTKLG